MDHSNDTTVVGNIAEDNERRGVYVYYSDNCDITGNTFENNSMSGIYLTGSSFNTISDNIARDNVYHGIALEPYLPAYSDSNIITNNILHNNNISGIYLEVPHFVKLDYLKMISPNIKQLGLLYNPNTMPKILEELTEACIDRGLEIYASPIRSSADLGNALKNFQTIIKVDALYLPQDNIFLDKSTSPVFICPFKNWIINTFQPFPQARNANPMADVVLPFPFPVYICVKPVF